MFDPNVTKIRSNDFRLLHLLFRWVFLFPSIWLNQIQFAAFLARFVCIFGSSRLETDDRTDVHRTETLSFTQALFNFASAQAKFSLLSVCSLLRDLPERETRSDPRRGNLCNFQGEQRAKTKFILFSIVPKFYKYATASPRRPRIRRAWSRRTIRTFVCCSVSSSYIIWLKSEFYVLFYTFIEGQFFVACGAAPHRRRPRQVLDKRWSSSMEINTVQRILLQELQQWSPHIERSRP